MINLKETKINYSKRFVTLLIATMLISSLFIGAAIGFLSNQSTFTDRADYVVLEGVASNDYYDTRQYSYQVNQWANETFCGQGLYGSNTNNPNPANNWFTAKKSLRIGFTEFGEFATLNNSGLAYGAGPAEWANSESWASTGIPSQLWIQGWVFYMNYTVQTTVRQIEAYAVYSNTVTTESGRGVYSWDGNVGTATSTTFTIPTSTVKTTGTLTPSGIQVLYDSARLVVVRSSVLIHDGIWPSSAGGDMDVAKITFTVVYNKDTKYAIVYKDVKILIPTKLLDSINDLAFSERYEIDLAYLVNPGNQAYVHWFHNYNQSSYMHPLTGQNLTDVVQAYDPLHQYIFFAGYWPNCTEFSVFAPLVPNLPAGYTRVLPQGLQQTDMPIEPNTPWVIAQWRYQSINAAYPNYFPKMLFFLANGVPNREIRFVEVFGMTDYNKDTTTKDKYYNTGAIPYNARDVDEAGSVYSLDTEVRYMLYGEVFRPEDLTTINKEPFQWIGLGQSAATTDSAGGLSLADLTQRQLQEPLGLFDRADTAFPWTAPVIGNKGTIPFGLSNNAPFNSPIVLPFTLPNTYFEVFNNVAKGTGTDPTSFVRTGLNNFAFNVYDDVVKSPPQPIAGGPSSGTSYWYPSKDPLTERWNGAFTNMVGYGGILYHPNGIISVGGEKANGLTRYFNDDNFAIAREGTAPGYALVNGGITGTAPTSNPTVNSLDYFPISTWASSVTPTYANTNDTMGFAVIALSRDENGTRGLTVYGWDARDTYWASAWTSQFLGIYVNNRWIPSGTMALIISISYSSPNLEPTGFTVVKALGTITEFGSNVFLTQNYQGGGFDAITGPAVWNGNIVIPTPLGSIDGAYKVWWFAKFPTTTTAKVDYDP